MTDRAFPCSPQQDPSACGLAWFAGLDGRRGDDARVLVVFWRDLSDGAVYAAADRACVDLACAQCPAPFAAARRLSDLRPVLTLDDAREFVRPLNEYEEDGEPRMRFAHAAVNRLLAAALADRAPESHAMETATQRLVRERMRFFTSGPPPREETGAGMLEIEDRARGRRNAADRVRRMRNGQ